MDNMEKLADLAAEWQVIKDRGQRNRFYDEAVFPAICEVVVSREQQKYPDMYTHLILPVGLSPEPLILTIRSLKPDRVYLLYTRQSESYLDRIVAESGLRISQLDKDEIDDTNVPDIYQKVKGIYEKWGRPAQLAVDISGGKKSMVGAVTLAGSLLGATIFYMDSDFLQELRKPTPGSEHLVVLENPYDVFGDLKMQRAKDLYDELDYVGAFRVLDELSRQTSTPETYEARSTLCDAYAAWDDWRIPQAIEKLSDSIQAIQRYRRNNPATPLSNQKDILQEQLDLLRRLNDAMSLDIKVAEQQFHLLTTPQLYQPLIGTLRAGALRQEKRGKFDVAALLWYRLIELFSQRRLSQYGVLSGQPEYDKTAIDLDILLKRYQIAYGSKKGKSAPPERLPREISLLDGYALLIALTDPLVQNLHLGTIRNQISVRNLGIFAHGFKPLKREDYSQFKSLATTLSERFFEIEQEFSSDWDKATFIESI